MRRHWLILTLALSLGALCLTAWDIREWLARPLREGYAAPGYPFAHLLVIILAAIILLALMAWMIRQLRKD